MVTLQLENDELDILAAFSWTALVGSTDTRNTLEEKLQSVFEQIHGATVEDVFADIHLTTDYSDWLDANKVAEAVKNYHNARAESDAPRVTFEYHGSQRVVENPEFKGHLLGGVEVRKDGVRTEQYKNYLLSEITF